MKEVGVFNQNKDLQMEDETLRKFAKICFRLSIIFGVILCTYFVLAILFGLPLNGVFSFFFGIALLLYVPKLHLRVIDAEKKYPKTTDTVGKKVTFCFFFGGCVLIIVALLDFLNIL